MDAWHRDRTGWRLAHGRGRRAARSGEDDWAAVEQIPWAERKATGVAVAVLQVDATVLDPHHRADIAGLCVLDHQAKIGRVLG